MRSGKTQEQRPAWRPPRPPPTNPRKHVTTEQSYKEELRDEIKSTKRKATGIQVAEDRTRCGIAMAARDNNLWGAGTQNPRQMCPACCSKERGYAWHETGAGKWRWQTAKGKEGNQADLMHVLCGECVGIPEEQRLQRRADIASGLRKARAQVTGKGKTRAITRGYKDLIDQIAWAQQAFAKKSTRATAAEKEALRKWFAGQLPAAGGEQTAKVQGVEKAIAQAIRGTQTAAAALQQAWQEASKEENRRRATREGGREGTQWKGIGLEVWKAGAHAVKLGNAKGDTHGWTMATALIWYKTRANTKKQARLSTTQPIAASAPAQRAHDDHNGKGVVIFDIESTELIDEEVNIRDMETSVACAQWIPAGTRTLAEAQDNAEALTVWHTTVMRTPQGAPAARMERLLTWFDKAKAIVAFNGSAFDMQVLRRHYGTDEQRWQQHMRKLRDPMTVVQQVTGRRHKLSALLKANGIPDKSGVGSDAPQWWQQGKLQQLEAYCARDTAALMELVMREHIRLPGLQSTAEISILEALRDDKPREPEQQPQDSEKEEDDNSVNQEKIANPHSKRKRTSSEASTSTNQHNYDETKRRKIRKRNPVYVTYLDTRTGHGTSKRRAILMGTAAIEQTVRGQYDWRDGDLGPVRGARRRYWHDTLDNG